MKRKNELENIDADVDELTDVEAYQIANKLVTLAGVNPADDDDTKLKKVVEFIHNKHLME